MVATAYPDRRDGVQTPAHTLGDDSLLIKYINPKLFAFATLSPEAAGPGEAAGGDAGDLNGKGRDLTVSFGVDFGVALPESRNLLKGGFRHSGGRFCWLWCWPGLQRVHVRRCRLFFRALGR